MPNVSPPPTYAEVILVDERLQKAVFNPAWLKWFLDIYQTLNAAGGLTIDHNALDGLQGGMVGEYYHLTQAQHTAIGGLGTFGNNQVVFTDGTGALSTEAALGYDSSTNTFSADNVVLGSSGSNTLTINSGTWTIGNNFIATRAAGAQAAGITRLTEYLYTFSGDAGGTTDVRANTTTVQTSGSNNITNQFGFVAVADHATTSTITGAQGAFVILNTLSSSGNVAQSRGVAVSTTLSSSGSITTRSAFEVIAPSLSSTGAITTFNGVRIGNIGHATLVTNAISFLAANSTIAATTTVSFRSEQNAGTGAWGFLHSGTANNAFNGSVRIGSNVAPTVALDVTGSVIISGNTTLGDASGDTLTLNAGTWTVGNNFTATRAIGVAAAGAQTGMTWTTTASGDAGGTSDIQQEATNFTISGSNSVAAARMTRPTFTCSMSAGTLTNMTAHRTSIAVSGAGNVTNAVVNQNSFTLSSSGNITTAIHYDTVAPSLSSTGAITAIIGYHVNNLGHATLVTSAIGFDQATFTASATLTAGFRSAQNSGTGAWGFLHTGTANNAFAGNVRIGSTTTPTVPLDVTGAALFSSTVGVSGTFTLSGTAANIATGSNFISNGGTDAGLSFDASNNATLSADLTVANQIASLGGVTSAGNFGTPVIVAVGRSTAQSGAVASVSTFTVGAADGSFEVSANVNVTTSTLHDFTVTCAYTDETNTARTLTLGFTQLSGATFLTNITNVTGAGPYESPTYHIRCKAATAITIATTGTFTTVTYNVEGIIKQVN